MDAPTSVRHDTGVTKLGIACATSNRLNPQPSTPLASGLLGKDTRNGTEVITCGASGNRSIKSSLTRTLDEKSSPLPPISTIPAAHIHNSEHVAERSPERKCRKGRPFQNTGFARSSHACSVNQYPASDAEKQSYNGYGTPSVDGRVSITYHPDTQMIYIGDEPLEPRETPETEIHLKRILIHLSALSPLLAAWLSLYSVIALILLLLTYPLRFCNYRQPLSEQLSRALIPVIRVQLRLIYSEYPANPRPYTPMLIIVSIVSPLYATGIAVASWVSAVFWIYAAILGEPNQSSRPERDGRAAVLWVRRRWEHWLERGLGI